MFVDEVCDVVDAAVDDDVEFFGFLVVLGHVGDGECFGHFLGRSSGGGWRVEGTGAGSVSREVGLCV